MRTPVCELLGIEQPIVQAPMSAVPELAAAVSNAGALGMLALTWSTPAGDPVRETAALTDRPFGGNLILNSDQHRRLDEALEAGMRIVSLMWGDPAGYVEQVHDANGVVLHTVGSAEEARRAVASGVDVVVAQGWEAGGHVWGQVATLPLVPAVVDAVAPVPVIAAGGIGDARGVAAVFALGAQAAWLGTRFLLAQEMPIHEEYRRRLMDAAETDAQWYPNLYEVGWPERRTAPCATRPPRCGRPRAGPHWGVDRARATSSPTSPPAKRSSATRRRRRWSVPPVISKHARCGRDRALLSPGSRNQQPRSWPSSSPACSRRGKGGLAFGHPLGELRPRRRRLERVREVLGLVGHQVVTEFHDAHRVRRNAVVRDYAFAHPQRTGAKHPPQGEVAACGVAAALLRDGRAADEALARLRVIEDRVLGVQAMLSRCRRLRRRPSAARWPGAFQGRWSLWHLLCDRPFVGAQLFRDSWQTRGHKSSTMSSRGCEQQMSTLP